MRIDKQLVVRNRVLILPELKLHKFYHRKYQISDEVTIVANRLESKVWERVVDRVSGHLKTILGVI